MRHKLIKNACIINEGSTVNGDVHICNERIERIGANISLPSGLDYLEINADGLLLIPGMIDAHVHFREPGLTHKGDISTESAAAVAGGITSFLEMPNTLPNTLTKEKLEEKFELASRKSHCNYSFFMGLTRDNLDEVLSIDPTTVCGITDDGLYFNHEKGMVCNHTDYLEKLFSRCEHLIALHLEDENIIEKELEKHKNIYGELIPPRCHSLIRNNEACVNATKQVIALARKHGNRLHLLHLSTAEESNLLDSHIHVSKKRITGEVCVHHLFFNDTDYEQLENLIKWNPAIKSIEDQQGLLHSVLSNRIDIIATDHAPHLMHEKIGNYFHVKPGGPLVQHALPALLEMHRQGKIDLETIVEKTSHHVAEVYRIRERGYIREGYYADLALIDPRASWTVTNDNILYKCKWSPFLHHTFRSKVVKVLVNGKIAFSDGQVHKGRAGKRLTFKG